VGRDAGQPIQPLFGVWEDDEPETLDSSPTFDSHNERTPRKAPPTAAVDYVFAETDDTFTLKDLLGAP
jgi:hypothetical protein